MLLLRSSAIRAIWISCLVLFVSGSAWAQGPAPRDDGTSKPYVLRLKQGLVDTAQPIDVAAEASYLAGWSRRVVLQLDGPLDPARRAQLLDAGVTLGAYLPDNAFVAQFEQANAQALSNLSFVRWIGPFQNSWKIDPRLSAARVAHHVPPGAQAEHQITITLFADEPLESALEGLDNLGVEVLGWSQVGKQWVVDAQVATDAVGQIAEMGEIQFVEPAPRGDFRNDTNEWIVQSNVPDYTPVWDAGLLGQGQIAGVIDGTIKEAHCAFDDSVAVGPDHRKLVALRNASSISSHGTHVAGTLAGDAGTYGAPDQYDGIAPAAKLSFSNSSNVWSNPSTLYARLQDAYNDGAYVHSNSWGDDYTTAYTTWCRQIDQFSYDYEDSLVLFAVTNGSTLKTPENAKNVLAVGASRDAPLQDSFCSGGMGPTADGRRKPEVYAPGCSTMSARSSSDCDYYGMTGTSMACPAVAGAGVLVRQYFTNGYFPSGRPSLTGAFAPSGALIKAMLVNSAVDMTNIAGYPSNREGWGRILLDNSLYFEGDPERLHVVDVWNADGLNGRDNYSLQVNVFSEAVPLHLTLVFTEPPATVNVSDPVINDLNLQVFSPGGSIYRGNYFADGQSTPGGEFDTRNNVEQILLPTPEVGTYTVVVYGTAINEGPQGFALVMTGDLSPARGDCNRNGHTDLEDYPGLAACIEGPDAGLALDCTCADLDDDGDADLADFAAFTRQLIEVAP